MTKICPSCGNKVDQKAKICPKCGHDFTKNLYENIPPYLGIMGIQPQKKNKQALPFQKVQPAPSLTTPQKTQPRVQPPRPQSRRTSQPRFQTTSKRLKPKQVAASTAVSKRPQPSAPAMPRQKVRAKTTTPKPKTGSVYKPQRRHTAAKSAPKIDRMTSHNEFHALHVIVGVIVAIIALIAIFCVVGDHYYSRQRQVDSLTTLLKDPRQQPSEKIITTKTAVKVTPASLKPLQVYYQTQPSALKKTKAALKNNHSYRGLKLVQKGTYWSLFPKYLIEVPLYQLKVSTNQEQTNLALNGHDNGVLTKKKNAYQKVVANLLPGKYSLLVQKGKQKVARSLNLWRDQELTLNTRKPQAKPQKEKTSQNTHRAAIQLLQRSYTKPQANDFINSSRNRDYYTLHAITSNHHYRVSVALSLFRKTGHVCHVNYRLTYHFNHQRRQVMAYTNAVLIKNKNNLQIQTVGSGRVVSAN